MSLQKGKTLSTARVSAAPRFGRLDADPAEVQAGIDRSTNFLLSKQHPDGYWCGELEADSMLEADYIFLHTLLETGNPGRLKRALAEMMRYQNEDGSWSLYPGGPGNISLSVKCYSSAKLMGIGPEDPRLVKCRMRSLGCVPCTGAIRSEADTLPKIIEEMISFRRSERENRAIDHDEEGSMEMKKREGYF